MPTLLEALHGLSAVVAWGRGARDELVPTHRVAPDGPVRCADRCVSCPSGAWLPRRVGRGRLPRRELADHRNHEGVRYGTAAGGGDEKGHGRALSDLAKSAAAAQCAARTVVSAVLARLDRRRAYEVQACHRPHAGPSRLAGDRAVVSPHRVVGLAGTDRAAGPTPGPTMDGRRHPEGRCGVCWAASMSAQAHRWRASGKPVCDRSRR